MKDDFGVQNSYGFCRGFEFGFKYLYLVYNCCVFDFRDFDVFGFSGKLYRYSYMFIYVYIYDFKIINVFLKDSIYQIEFYVY